MKERVENFTIIQIVLIIGYEIMQARQTASGVKE